MNTYGRRSLIGLLAGACSGVILLLTLPDSPVGLLLGSVVGICFTLAFRPAPKAYAQCVMMAAVGGLVLWIGISLFFLPLLSGQPPQWTAQGMRLLFPALVGWVLYGASLGLLVQGLSDLAMHVLGPEYERPKPSPVIETRIVIVGGGFAGMATAEHLERRFGADPTVSFTLVSASNSLLFTPMLAEVAGGSLEAIHICAPLRTSLRRTHVVYGQVEHIDVEQKRLLLAPEGHSAQQSEVPFDHLVLAVGSVSNFLGLKEVEKIAFDFKSVADAMRIREQALHLLELADREPDPARRKEMLTFVIVGAGFAGAELAGALNDLVRGALFSYPNLTPADVQVMVVHAHDHILPELSPSLGDYALQRMTARGVTFKLKTRLINAQEGVVRLQSQEEIRMETLIWAAGSRPHRWYRRFQQRMTHEEPFSLTIAWLFPALPASGRWAIVPASRMGKRGNPVLQRPSLPYARQKQWPIISMPASTSVP
jgi:NADH dehydrogenase